MNSLMSSTPETLQLLKSLTLGRVILHLLGCRHTLVTSFGNLELNSYCRSCNVDLISYQVDNVLVLFTYLFFGES